MQLADFITLATTRDANLVRELAESRVNYISQRQNIINETSVTINRLRPCQADNRLRQWCLQYIRSTNRLPTEELVQRQCYRLNLRVAKQLKELIRGRYV